MYNIKEEKEFNRLEHFEQFKYAIEHRISLKFHHGGLERIVAPHLLGLKNDSYKLLALQIGGRRHGGLNVIYVSSEDSYSWELFDVGIVTPPRIVDRQWCSDKTYLNMKEQALKELDSIIICI